MIYVETGSTDAYFNFGLEQYLMEQVGTGAILGPVFLFWQTKPTLMVGHFQNIHKEIDERYAKGKGIQIVRRASGGGTIYTDMGGWQFSHIVQNVNFDEIDFAEYTKNVIAALCAMGVNAYANGRNDILVDGKKISGNAQYVTRKGKVHHGSLLFQTDIGEMVAALTPSKDKITSKGIDSVRQRVGNIADYLKTDMTPAQFKSEMLERLLQNVQVYQLTEQDRKAAQNIAEEKFRSWEWNYGSQLVFEVVRERKFAGGKMQCCLNIKDGKINRCIFYGDFFCQGDIDVLINRLIGTDYHEASIRSALREANAGQIFHMISEDEIMECIL
ncbi:lipoate--protein ligase [Christensenella timonensis]|uniref:lipoate--protein ligase n=1 Tax=Christensenella timonensis TaxID=1816678 RepID=UPI00082C215C|nr:lipoate--protein ligase [Christensenella timonensis]